LRVLRVLRENQGAQEPHDPAQMLQ